MARRRSLYKVAMAMLGESPIGERASRDGWHTENGGKTRDSCSIVVDERAA